MEKVIPGTNYFAELNQNVNIAFTNEFGFAVYADCIGNPNTVAINPGIFWTGCWMIRNDILTGINIYTNQGTLVSPSWVLNGSGGGGGSPGGVQYDVQLNDGAGGFAGSNNLNFQGGYLTINGDSGYGQLQFLNSPITGGYAGAGISGIDDEIIVGALAGDMTFWSSQAMNFSSDTGNTNMLSLDTSGNLSLLEGAFIGPNTAFNIQSKIQDQVDTAGGPISITASNGNGEAGGADISITAGSATSIINPENGGNINLVPGNGSAGGFDGTVLLPTGTKVGNAVLDASITGANTFTFPNATGTFALTSDIPSPLSLETNGTPNGSQSLLNLVAGTNITLTDNGTGSVTVDASGGGTPGGLNAQIQYNNSGAFGGITGATTDGTIVSLNGAHLLNPTINGAGTGLATLTYPNTSTSVSIAFPATAGTLALTSQLTSGTVTNVSSADANATVATPTTTPVITIVSAPKLATARTIGTLTGDATTAGSSFDGTANNTNALTLATVNSNVGSFGSATQSLSITANGKGLITAISAQTVTPAVGSITGLGTGIATFLATPSSANLAAAVTDETGSGALVFGTGPTITLASASTAITQAPSDNSTKIATTAYVAAALLGQDFKEACKYATTAALPAIVYNNGTSGVGATLTAVSFGAITLDGSTPSVGDRVLIKNQVSTFQNGIYVVTVVGAVATLFVLTRSADFNQSFEINTGDSVFISAGSTQATTTWAYNGVDSPTMGTDAITFAQTAGQGSFTAGNGISITGVSIAIDTSVTVDKTTAQTLTNKTLTSPILTAPALGTPTSGVMTNVTGTATALNIGGSAASLSISGQTGLLTVTGLTSTNRIKTVRDAADTILELGGSYTPTGTWTSLTLVTPALGTPASGVATNLTSLPAANLLIGSQATGDLLYASSTTVWSRLGIGSAGKHLQGGSTPSWTTETYAAPGTSGNVMTSDGTNWISQAATGGSFSSTSGTSNGPATSSTQTITHGLGRTPIIVRLSGFGTIQGSTSSSTYNSSWGTWNASNNNCVYINSTFNAGGVGPLTSSSFAIFLSNGGNLPNTGHGVVGNVTSTSFDIVWTITGSIAGGNTNFLWEAQ